MRTGDDEVFWFPMAALVLVLADCGWSALDGDALHLPAWHPFVRNYPGVEASLAGHTALTGSAAGFPHLEAFGRERGLLRRQAKPLVSHRVAAPGAWR